jgi:hypothetical protein
MVAGNGPGRPYQKGLALMTSNVHPADALLVLKAQIANLESLAKIEHARLVAMGVGAHEGEMARASVSIAERETIDYKTIVVKLDVSRQMLRAHTTAKEVTTVRVVARTGT